jgi:hypothetical protein
VCSPRPAGRAGRPRSFVGLARSFAAHLTGAVGGRLLRRRFGSSGGSRRSRALPSPELLQHGLLRLGGGIEPLVEIVFESVHGFRFARFGRLLSHGRRGRERAKAERGADLTVVVRRGTPHGYIAGGMAHNSDAAMAVTALSALARQAHRLRRWADHAHYRLSMRPPSRSGGQGGKPHEWPPLAEEYLCR